MADWVPWCNRDSEPEQRIHQNLTETARNRILYTINEVASKDNVSEAYRRYRLETGQDIEYFTTKSIQQKKESLNRFLKEEELDDVLTFIEIFLNKLWEATRISSDSHYPVDTLLSVDEYLRRILVEEGILLRIQPEREKIERFAEKISNHQKVKGGYQSRHSRPSHRTLPDKDFNIQFERLANQSIVESDQAVRALAKTQRWQDELKPYNEAWAKYQDEQFSYIIPEKLYNSLEATLVKICVEEQGWNSEKDGVGRYLNSIKENGLFEPNKAMIGEWQQIVSGIQVGVQRTGDDRKRHENIDQDYCILLLHQVGAFLTFIINRYEDEYLE